MSGLARYFHSRGAEVSGYDKTATDLTRELEESGINIHYYEDTDLIPKQPDLVVYTPAVPKAHAELAYYQQQQLPVLKRSEVLGLITQHSFNICVAGTHGKTTTSTMIAHLLRETGYGCNAFLGGISVNYGVNFWSSEKNVCVIEADEYDRSFLRLSPDVAIITSMDPDHLDIYGTPEAMEDAFIQFAGKLKPGGLLVSKHGLKRQADLKAPVHYTYGVNKAEAGVHTANIEMSNGSYAFDVLYNGRAVTGFTLNIGGLHNVENMTAAIAVALRLGIDEEAVKRAAASFRGVKRRFEYVLKNERQVLIDDYAHHPEELRALLSGARALFAGKKLVVVFQPHLYTRTRDLAAGFAESLSLADEAVLLPIYPARELPIEGVSSEMITGGMNAATTAVLDKDALLLKAEQWKNEQNLALVMAGAGDIDLLVGPVSKILND